MAAKKSQLIMVPDPNRSGRWSVFDPVTQWYVPGAIHIPEQRARNFVGHHQPEDWKKIALANGWTPPVEEKHEPKKTHEVKETQETAVQDGAKPVQSESAATRGHGEQEEIGNSTNTASTGPSETGRDSVLGDPDL